MRCGWEEGGREGVSDWWGFVYWFLGGFVWGGPFFSFSFSFWEKGAFGGRGDSSFFEFLNYSNPKLIISSSIPFFLHPPNR